MRHTETGCPRGIRFSASSHVQLVQSILDDQAYVHIMSFYREKTLYIDVAVFGKKCYTNARRTSNRSQQRLLCEEVLSLA